MAHVARAHSRCSPSSAHRWLRCPGALNAEEGIADTAGLFAAEGTAFHEWAADCLEFDLEPENLLGATMQIESGWITDEDGDPVLLDPRFEIFESREEDDESGKSVVSVTGLYTFVMDNEMARHMRAGLARVRDLARESEPGSVLLFVERRVDISPWTLPDHSGSADVIVVDLARLEITVFDWKFGAGIPVSPIENDQARLYALGVWNEVADLFPVGTLKADIKVRIIIEQPRAPGGGGEWTLGLNDLLEWGLTVKDAAKATTWKDAPRIPGEKQCQWCKAKKSCGELSAYLMEMADLKFEELDDAMELDLAPPLKQVHDLTPAECAFITRNAKLFRDWLDAIHKSLMQDYMNGAETPGVKMVYGQKGKRAYPKGDMAEMAQKLLEAQLGEEAYVKKLLSPAQAEKVLSIEGYAELSAYVRKADGKPILVSENDARAAVPKWDERFDDEPAE